MKLDMDFASQEFFRDPAARLKRLQAAGPVVEITFPIVGRVWMATTQETAARVLKDGRAFTLRKDDGTVAGLRWWMPRIFRVFANSMLNMDEPDHARLRGLVDEAFRRRAALDMEPRIRAIAGDLADDLFAQGSPADLVTRYARLLPLSVICELLGLPLGDRPKFIAWAGRATGVSSTLGFFRLVPTIAAMKRYLEQHIERLRTGGGEGLIAELVRVEKEGARLTRDEMISMVFLLLLAGHETTTHLISGSVFELAKNPGCATGWRRIGAAPTWRSRSSCVSSRQCNSPNRGSCGRRWSWAAPGLNAAIRSWRCWRPPTWIRRQTARPSSSISRAGRTTTWPSAPASISASVISSRGWKENVRSRLCTRVGRRSRWRSSRNKSAGAAGPACGRSSACR
jgi:cytochrome P450